MPGSDHGLLSLVPSDDDSKYTGTLQPVAPFFMFESIMCQPTSSLHKSSSTTTTTTTTTPRLLLTTQSFQSESNTPPDRASTYLTLAFHVTVLFVLEYAVVVLLENYQDVHPILGIELNRKILARHCGVDFVCLAAVSWIGLANRHHLADLFACFFSLGKQSLCDKFENRLFKFIPGGNHVLMVFLGYQLKNLYDSYVWNDGIVFILHHILAGVAAWGGMYPGCAQYYAIFFMGISEVSTLVLVLLANFDENLGVEGLDHVLPMTRVVIGLAFVLAFIYCRTLLWPTVTYFFVKDVSAALSSDSVEAKQHKTWLCTFVFTLTGLSFLQIIFLGQILLVTYEEIQKLMT